MIPWKWICNPSGRVSDLSAYENGKPWSELECLIAGRLSTEPPYWNESPELRLPLARVLLDIVSEWEPMDNVCADCAGRGYAYQCDDPEDHTVPCPTCAPEVEA